MTLEELIYQRLTTDLNLTAKLTTYDEKPAVFYSNAPSDLEDSWETKQYPRIDFIVDMQGDPERKSSGMVELNIFCRNTGATPEEIKPCLVSCLDNIFVKPDNEPVYCLSNMKSETFDKQGKNGKFIITGITITFDIFAFPLLETTDPDPVMAANHFLKQWNSEAYIIGYDEIDQYYAASDIKPAFYCRLTDFRTAQETNTVVWVEGAVFCHVFSDSPENRLKWIKALTDELALRGEILMLDHSPMFFTSIQVDNTVDYLVTGQIRLNVRYGLLRRKPYTHLVENIHVSQKGGVAMRKETVEKPTVEKAVKTLSQDAEYSIDELASAAARFPGKPSYECVFAALKLKGISKCTIKQAEKYVDEFMNKEVN